MSEWGVARRGALGRPAHLVCLLGSRYYKTGSLIANSCRSIAMLGRYPDYVCEAAFRYGLHAGVAFQLIDDLLGELCEGCTCDNALSC